MWPIIDEFVYLGRLSDACTPSILLDYGITHLVNLTTTKLILDDSFEILHLPLRDSLDENIVDIFDETNRFIRQCEEEKKGRCLVFCKHARSRSVSIVLAYLMKYHSHSLKSAYQILVEIHPQIQPNRNYFKQLHKYSSQLNRTVYPFISS